MEYAMPVVFLINELPLLIFLISLIRIKSPIKEGYKAHQSKYRYHCVVYIHPAFNASMFVYPYNKNIYIKIFIKIYIVPVGV